MRLFQNAGIYPAYLPRLNQLAHGASTFARRLEVFLADRYGASHILKPVYEADASVFFTNADDQVLQQLWAREHGMPAGSKPPAILLAQIEHHRAEVFYNMDPMRYGSDFVRRLPGCVKHAIAWRAAPSAGADFSAYQLIVCNFPGILQSYADRGWRGGYLSPSHDPEMDAYAANTARPVDILFVGGYSRHHRRRAEILEAVVASCKDLKVVFHLDRSRLTRLAESIPGRLLPLEKHRRPADIRAVSAAPIFGRQLYAALSAAKIVLNGAVDMAGEDRGNMRCFEAMGCGALMVSDKGNYPAGMVDGETMRLYSGVSDVVAVLRQALAVDASGVALARNGHARVRDLYSKSNQWAVFKQLVGGL